jgi:glycerophosphoryl diester phosphodiesterase
VLATRATLLGALPVLATAAFAGGGAPWHTRVAHHPAVIAHRGGSALAPENTLAALRRAHRLGVDYVEIDVRATSDGALVLLHDRSVDRTTDGTGDVADLTLAAVRGLDAGSHFSPRYARERVPTLDEALAYCRDRVLVYLDHKAGSVAEVLAALDAHAMGDRVVVYSGLEQLREWKRVAPDVAVMLSPEGGQRSAAGLRALLGDPRVEVLDGGAHEWTAELVAAAHELGALVYVDNLGPLDTESGWGRSIAMGVDGIQTDCPDRLLELLSGER